MSDSLFGVIPEAPVDPILSVTQRYKQDTDPRKVNLGVGAYRDDNDKPFVLRAVREAEDMIVSERLDKEYVPQDGIRKFCAEATTIMYGNEIISKMGNQIASIQTISGTGALCIGFSFLLKFLGENRPIYFPNPTWGNHPTMAAHIGFKNIRSYAYYDAETRGLNFEGMVHDLTTAPEGSIFLLHLCAHNPTGVDPTEDQWRVIHKIMKERNHVTFFDSAYQGFASGDLDRDAFAVRYFVSQGTEVFTAQSFAKNMGMYGERVGCLSVVTSNAEQASHIYSQLKTIVRALYSSPPLHGARIVERVLSTKSLYNLWIEDLVGMSNRIKSMRAQLFNKLVELKTPGDWKHITDQIGMFSYTGLNVKQSNRMIEKHHIYMLTNGRISMAGLNTRNVEYVANAIHECVTNGA